MEIKFNRNEPWIGWRRDPHGAWIVVQPLPCISGKVVMRPDQVTCACGHRHADHEYTNRAGRAVAKKCCVPGCNCGFRVS